MTEKERKRIKNYYERVQYEPENFNENLLNLFSDTTEIFNPVKDITKALTAAAIKDLHNKNEEIQKIWEYNSMQSFCKKICKEMYLEEVVFVEVIKNKNEEILYILHNVDNIEYDELFGEILKFKIAGEKSYYDDKGQEIVEEFEREYIKLENGKIKKVEKINGDILEAPFLLEKIPVIKFKSDSNIIEALNIIDRINEIEAYIRGIFNIHGDPLLHIGNIKEFANKESKDVRAKSNAELLEKARYKNKRMVYTLPTSQTEREPFFKYVELANSMVPEMQNDISRMEQRLANLFPEFLLVDTKTQNVSQETYSMKNNGLRTKILTFRTDFLKGMLEVDNIALRLKGRNQLLTLDDYIYLDPFEESERVSRLNTLSLMLDVIEKAKNIDEEMELKEMINKISKETVQEIQGVLG